MSIREIVKEIEHFGFNADSINTKATMESLSKEQYMAKYISEGYGIPIKKAKEVIEYLSL